MEAGAPTDAWGVGCYEDTAADLAPASEVAVTALGLAAGERVLDIGCGTGNAALDAARAGARVAGVDPSPRLLGVARERVPDGRFVEGSATELPFADDGFDAVVSVFGLIFAGPAERAVAEAVRVLRPGGRAAITSWPPRGALFAAVSAMRDAVASVRPPEGPPPRDWGNPAVIEELLGPHGSVEITEHHLPRETRSAEEVWERWESRHPMWIGARRVLEPAGEWDGVRERVIAALREGDGEAAPYLLTLLRLR